MSKTHTHVDFKWVPEENVDINDQNETSDENNLLLFMQMLHENILSESSDCPDNLRKSGSEGALLTINMISPKLPMNRRHRHPRYYHTTPITPPSIIITIMTRDVSRHMDHILKAWFDTWQLMDCFKVSKGCSQTTASSVKINTSGWIFVKYGRQTQS